MFPVCESINIKWYKDLEKLRNCTVIEGNLVISIIEDLSKCENLQDLNEVDRNTTDWNTRKCIDSKMVREELSQGKLTFPELREVTDFVLLYNTKHMTTLSTLFPNLTVIRGNRLIKV